MRSNDSSSCTCGGRRLPQPLPVWVHLGRLFARAVTTHSLTNPRGGSAGGVLDRQAGNGSTATARVEVSDEEWVLDGEAPGMLLEWNRSGRGLWVGLVAFELAYAGGRDERHQLPPQLVPEYALRLRTRPAVHRRRYPYPPDQ